MVFESEGGGEDDDPVCDQCHEVAGVLLIHHHVHHEDEQCKEDVVDELKTEEDPQVQPDLEMEIAHPYLAEHSGRRQEAHECDQRETQPQELACEEDPFRYRHGVGNLAQPGVSFPRQTSAPA